LKYGPVLKVQSIEKNPDGSIKLVKVEALINFTEKLKGHIHWVSEKHSVTVTCNLYSVHFLIENVKEAKEKWLDHLNPNSLVVKKNAKMWNL
jgi:hypothetical protein